MMPISFSFFDPRKGRGVKFEFSQKKAVKKKLDGVG
tara:strand:+ start:1294 stop:1401 length:108 start_codon:yes stop_codon:yes gene_type:complete